MLQKSDLGRTAPAERAQQVVVLGWAVQHIQVLSFGFRYPRGFSEVFEPRALCCKMLRASSGVSLEPSPGVRAGQTWTDIPSALLGRGHQGGADLGSSGRHCLPGLHLAIMLPCLELNPSERILLLPVLKHLTCSS